MRRARTPVAARPCRAPTEFPAMEGAGPARARCRMRLAATNRKSAECSACDEPWLIVQSTIGIRARPRDTLAERPVAGTGAMARYPQTAGFASNESARPRDTLAERPVAGTGAMARYPQTAGVASNESARPRAFCAGGPALW